MISVTAEAAAPAYKVQTAVQPGLAVKMVQTDTAIRSRAHAAEPFVFTNWIKNWPPAFIAGGLMLTAAWIVLLGFVVATFVLDLI